MPVKGDQYFASVEALSIIIEAVITPRIKDIEQELGKIFVVDYLSVAKGKELLLIEQNDNNAECKVCIWNTFSEHRKIYQVALRLIPKDKDTGYSGFNIKGDIKAGVVRQKSMAHLYNNGEYPGW